MDEITDHGAEDPRALAENTVVDAIKKEIPDAEENYELNLKLVAEREFKIRHRLLTDSVKTDKVADWLRISPQAVRGRISSKSLLALQDGKDYFFPVWQFDARMHDGLVAGFSEVLQALKTSDMSYYAIANWLSSPNKQLNGQSPINMLQAGGERMFCGQSIRY